MAFTSQFRMEVYPSGNLNGVPLSDPSNLVPHAPSQVNGQGYPVEYLGQVPPPPVQDHSGHPRPSSSATAVIKPDGTHTEEPSKGLYGSGDFEDGYTLNFANMEDFEKWRRAEEDSKCIEFVKGDVHLSKAVPPRFREHTKLVCARHTRSGRKKYVKKHPERQRKVPSRKLEGGGCPASISFKTYHGTDEIRASYNPQHSHEIGDANLPFTRRGRRAIVAAGQQAKKRRSSTLGPSGPMNGDFSVNDGVADASGSTNDEDDASADGEDGLQQHAPFVPDPTLHSGNVHHHHSSQQQQQPQQTHQLQAQPTSPTRPPQPSGTPPIPSIPSPSISRPRPSVKNPNPHHHHNTLPPNQNQNQVQNKTHASSHAQNHPPNPTQNHTHQMQQSTSLPPLTHPTHPMPGMQLQPHIPPQSQPIQPHQALQPQSVLASQAMLPPQPPPPHTQHVPPAPPPVQQSASLSREQYRWERIGELFDSLRHSARTVMFAPEDVLALEMIILRLHMQTPVLINPPPQPNMISPQHQQQQSPAGHHVHMTAAGAAIAGPSMAVNGSGNPPSSRNNVRR